MFRNAEFLHPLAWEILQAVIPTDENKVDVNAVDALFITLQENNGRSEAEHRAFLKKLVSGLNALSKHHTWNLDSAAFVELRNVIGTKMSAQGRKANHQTIYFIGRSHLPRAAIDECQWAYNKREKGFVGISVAFSDVGRVLVLGSHLPTSKENARKFVQELLDQIVRQCIPKEYRSEGEQLVCIFSSFSEEIKGTGHGEAYPTVASGSYTSPTNLSVCTHLLASEGIF